MIISSKDLPAKLSSSDDQQAEKIILDLASRGSDAMPELETLLSSPDPNLRWWATRALAEIEDTKVAALLRSALHDQDKSVRQCAALALRQRPESEIIPDLVALLKDEDRLLARLASDALIAAGASAVPALLKVMQCGLQAARLEAIRALALIGDQRSIATLFTALSDPSSIVEFWANEGLERMGIGMVFYRPGG